jgi:predicted metalloendopeptidase
MEMIENIRAAFIDMVSQSSWLDSQSKSKAIEKVKINYLLMEKIHLII